MVRPELVSWRAHGQTGLAPQWELVPGWPQGEQEMGAELGVGKEELSGLYGEPHLMGNGEPQKTFEQGSDS